MRHATWRRLGVAAGALGFGLSGLAAHSAGKDDASQYPPDVQKQYRVFAEKCSRCHDLERPYSARYTTEAQWRGLVARMARKPGAGISPKDQTEITQFLVYHQRVQSGNAPPSANEAKGAGTHGLAPAAPVLPASPPEAGNAGGGPPPSTGAAEGGGLKVEVDTMPSQAIVVPAGGRWTTEAPGPGENLFLSVRLFDAATGEKVPYATIHARVGADTAAPAQELRPLFGAQGFQYGANFSAPAGDLVVSLEVEPPPLGRVNDDGHRWTSPLNLKLTLHSR